MTKATRILLFLAAQGLMIVNAQQNPGLYFRVSRCNNIKATVYVNDKLLHSGSCTERLSWVPVNFNDALAESKNKLRLELKNEKDGDYYGAMTFELLAVNFDTQTTKKFFSSEVKLQDFDRFQMNLDGQLKKQGWSAGNVNVAPWNNQAIMEQNRKDSLNYLFGKHDRFYVVITAASHADYAVAINDQPILAGSLHISALDDAYGLKTYPYFFLNPVDKSRGKAMLTYELKPQEGKREAFLEITIQHYAPNAVDPQIIAISKITCPKDEVKRGDFDISEPLRRHGYFNLK